MDFDLFWIYKLPRHLPRRAGQDERGGNSPWCVRDTRFLPVGSLTQGTVEKQYGTAIQPIFISVDPPRDTPARIAAYLSDFHPRLIGLTGSYQDTKGVCKAYRVYFSTPPTAKADDDYLVDHSIFFYFMDPDGQFVDAFGKDTSMESVISRVQKEIGEWEKDARWKS